MNIDDYVSQVQYVCRNTLRLVEAMDKLSIPLDPEIREAAEAVRRVEVGDLQDAPRSEADGRLKVLLAEHNYLVEAYNDLVYELEKLYRNAGAQRRLTVDDIRRGT